MRARILHASQLRLDAPMVGFRDIDDAVRARLRDATVGTLDNIVQAACARQVDAVVFTGDLFAGPDHGVRAQLLFSGAVERLADHGIAVVAVAGQNDRSDPWFPAVTSWPDGVAIVPFGHHEKIGLRHRDAPLITIHAMAAGCDGVEHADRGPGLHLAAFGAPVDEMGADPEQSDDFDHVVHGGVMDRRVERRGGVLISTPGTAQHLSADDVAADSDGVGEADIIEVDNGGTGQNPERMPVGTVRIARLTVHVDPLVDLDALRATLEAEADAIATEEEGRAVVVIAELRGNGAAHRALLASPRRRADLLASLRSRSLTIAPFLWWASLDPLVETEPDDRSIERADFAAILAQLGTELSLPTNQPIREGWLRAFPSDLRAPAGDDHKTSERRWAEARRLAEASLATPDRSQR